MEKSFHWNNSVWIIYEIIYRKLCKRSETQNTETENEIMSLNVKSWPKKNKKTKLTKYIKDSIKKTKLNENLFIWKNCTYSAFLLFKEQENWSAKKKRMNGFLHVLLKFECRTRSSNRNRNPSCESNVAMTSWKALNEFWRTTKTKKNEQFTIRIPSKSSTKKGKKKEKNVEETRSRINSMCKIQGYCD